MRSDLGFRMLQKQTYLSRSPRKVPDNVLRLFTRLSNYRPSYHYLAAAVDRLREMETSNKRQRWGPRPDLDSQISIH